MKVLSIDPGYDRLGIAVIEKKEKQKELLIFSECVETSRTDLFEKRITHIGQEIKKVIEKYQPNAVALEKLYFSNNQKTAMHVSETRGVLMYEATLHNLPITEYTPNQIKVAVTGSGRSDKKQVWHMVSRLITIDKTIKHDDEWDAVAVGLTFFAHNRV